MIEIVLALCAFLGVNDVSLVLERDRSIGALEFTSAAHCALGGDDLIGHVEFSFDNMPGSSLPRLNRKKPERFVGLRHILNRK
jgi:hypothetical protein